MAKTPVLVALLLGAAPLAALGGFEAHIPLSAYKDASNPPLTASLPSHVHHVVFPTLGCPSIVAVGTDLRILLRWAGASPNPIVRLTTARHQITQNFTLPVARVQSLASGHLQVMATVPRNVTPEVYDLEVTTAAFREVQYSSVKVLERFPASFRFVHLADAQSGDPRGILEPAPRTPYRYDTVSIVKQAFEEIRFFDPAFVVNSGDLLFGIDYHAEYASGYELWKDSGFPVFQVPGNHDGYATSRLYQVSTLNIKAPPRDGLEFWTRVYGPKYYSFDFGNFHFVALNSYDGSPQRRDSITIVTLNSGGHVGAEQLQWFERDLRAAQAAGKEIVVFCHHDPRGEMSKANPYRPDRPFNLQTVINLLVLWLKDRKEAEGGVWNDATSGQKILALMLRYGVSHALIGHEHKDHESTFNGIRFIKTTTMSSSGQYWGYRLLEVRNNQIHEIDFDPAAGMQSIPSGNLKFDVKGSDGYARTTTITIRNGHPHSWTGRLRVQMPAVTAGYKVTGARLLRTVDSGAGGAGLHKILYLEVTVPAGAGLSAPSTHAVKVESNGAAPPLSCSTIAPGTPPPGFWTLLVNLGMPLVLLLSLRLYAARAALVPSSQAS